MKTEAEIRRYLGHLRKALATPFDCEGLEKLACMAHRMPTELAAQIILWVLGEDPDADRRMEELEARLQKVG